MSIERASTEAGRLYTEGSLTDALRRWGKDFTLRTVVLDIEREARADALTAPRCDFDCDACRATPE